MLDDQPNTDRAADVRNDAASQPTLPKGVVYSSSPDCLWAWARLLRLAREVEFQTEAAK
ncbi:MAG: hypothetical protein AAB229_03670 [Candidatus Hydrogenedentota bacterium]